MKNYRIATWVTPVVTILAVLATLLVPVPNSSDAVAFHTNLALSVATVLLYVGASLVIVMGFGAFTSKLRRAYATMFTGLIFLGLAYLQLPLIVLLGQINNSAYLGAATVPAIGAALFIFGGARMLARLFTIRSLATRWWFVLVGVVVAYTVTALTPHAATANTELEYDLFNGLFIVVATFVGFATYLILKIKRQASVALANPLAWLFLSLLVSTVLVGYVSTYLGFLLGDEANQVINIATIGPSVLAAALFLRSAYSFNKVVESADIEGTVARNFFGTPLKLSAPADITSIDIVTYTAGLVSNPADIDKLLDRVRVLTAHLPDRQHIGENEEKVLMDVYLQIEEYLLTKEPLRVFTKDALRQDVAQKLQLTLGTAGTFWRRLST